MTNKTNAEDCVMRRYGYSFLLGLLSLFSMTLAHADMPQGYAWLASQQQTDGSFQTNTDIANSTQATHEALVLGRLAGASLNIDKTAGTAFLAGLPYSDTESVAQALLVGVSQTAQGESLALILKSRQNNDGGFGQDVGYQSTPFDTYWAVTALEAAGNWDNTHVTQSLGYLLNKQSAQGGWAYQGDVSIYLTARVLSLLTRHSQYSSVISPINSARQFLKGQLDATTHLISGDSFNSAVVLSALVDAGDVGSVQSLAQALLAREDAVGSWAQDSWTTALVLQALLKNNAAGQGAGIAQLSGRVVVSGSNAPLAGVTVSVVGQNGLQVITGADGRFLLAGVKTGSVNLAFSHSGYNPVSWGNVVQAGEQKAFGDVPMAPGANTVLLTGVVLDDTTAQPIANASVSVTTNTAFTVQTDDKGVFTLTLPVASSYQGAVTASGYNAWTGGLNLVAGQNSLRIGLLPTGTVLNNQPGNLHGRVIDGTSGTGLSGAVIAAAGQTVTAGANGEFALANVARGTIAGTIAATGYQGINFSYPYPAGSSGAMGDIALYTTSATQAPTSSTLHLQITDALSQQPVANAQVSTDGKSATTDASGKAVIAGITSNSLTINVTATGYLAAQGQLNITGFGELFSTIPLTPETLPATTVSLSGKVTDLSGVAIAGAMVTVTGTSITTVSAADGTYALSDIPSLDFDVHATASGYQANDRSVQLQAFGQYTADLVMQPSQGNLFAVESVQAPVTPLAANQDTVVTADVHNLSGQSQTAIVRGLVMDMNGAVIATLPVYAPNTQTMVGSLDFAANDTLTLSLPWNTGQWRAGGYSLRVDVVKLGSMTRDLPLGVILASGASSLSIAGSQNLSGGFEFNPPMSQAGQTTQVALNALIRNTGNTPLAAGDYTLTIRNTSGVVIDTAVVSVPALAINEVHALDFGSWVPNALGNLGLSLQKNNTPTVSPLTGSYYVGDVGSGNFTLDQQVFAEGSHTTPAHISLQGVDLSQAVSTDKLSGFVKTSLANAANFESTESMKWQGTHNCLGCHIQTQSLYGMETSNKFLTMDALTKQKYDATMMTMYNAINADVAKTGYFHNGSQNTNAPAISALGLWALDTWPDKSSSYRARTKALGNIWNQRQVQGDGSIALPSLNWDGNYWGWMDAYNPESVFAATAPAIKHLVDEKNNNQLSNAARQDWALSGSLIPSRPLARGTFVDGIYIYIARSGGVDKFNTETNELTQVFSAPYQFMDVMLDEGVLYVTTQNFVLRVTGDTTGDVIYNSGAYEIHDLIKWNGDYYVTNANWAQVICLKKNGDGTFASSIFAQGNTLVWPTGLAVGRNGELVVGSYLGNRITAFDSSGKGHVIVENLPFGVADIEYDAQADAYYFTSSLGYTNTGAAALNRLNADGTVVRMAENSYEGDLTYYGVALVGHDIYVTDQIFGTLTKLVQTTLDDSVVDTVNANVPAMVQYLLNHRYAVANNNVLTAQSMVALSNFRSLLTDPILQPQVDDALGSMNVLLRSRQSATDGGWGLLDGWGSDPASTAWVGMGLDTLNPSPDDPAIRGSITYLLGAQMGDGSWNVGGYFGRSGAEHLGPTGLVLAYLPIALDRLGGLDMGLDVQSRPDVQLSGFNIAPTSSAQQTDGSTLYHWTIDGVTSTGRQIDFVASIADLFPGETRPVANNAALQFHNSFTNEVITRTLAVPTVQAINGVTLNVTTDSASYNANSPVQLTDLFANTGLALDGVVIKTVIRTAGGVVIDGLPDQTGIAIAQNGSGQVAVQWNTGTHMTGNYQVDVQLLDATGRVRAESVGAFTIVASNGTGAIGTSYATQVNTDKLLYTPFESVQIHERVRNLTVNAGQDAVLAKLAVTDGQGGTVFSRQWVVPAMAANGLLDYPDTLKLNDAVAGNYSVTLTLWDANVQNVLASSQYNFAVVADPLAYLTGSVTVGAVSVTAGQPESCTDRIQNRSQIAAIDAQIETVLLRAADQTVITTNTASQHFAAAETSTRVRNVDTAALTAGDYSCVLLAHTASKVSTLGYATFTVKKPDVSAASLDVSATIGQHGRLLVLLDDAVDCDKDGFDKDGLDKTGLAQQQAWLEAFLAAQGWSYTIVHNAVDFDRELNTDQYVVYGLFANHVTLSQATQLKLTSVVQSGEGLLESGKFNRSNNNLEKTLGITFTGREQQATGALLSAGVLAASSPAETFNPAHKLDLRDDAGDVLAVWQGVSNQHGDGHQNNDDDGHEHCDVDQHGDDHHVDSHDEDSHEKDSHEKDSHSNGRFSLANIAVQQKQQSVKNGRFLLGNYAQGNDQHGNHDSHSNDSHGDDVHSDDSHNSHDDAGHTCNTTAGIEPALVHKAYGTGHAVIAGFDLLDEATKASDNNSVYARMLAWSLQRVHPAVLARTGNNALPLLVHVVNKGAVEEVRYTLTTTSSQVVLATGWTALANGSLQVTGHLDLNGVMNLPQVYLTAGLNGEAAVQLLVETRPDSNAAWTSYQTENWPVATLP